MSGHVPTSLGKTNIKENSRTSSIYKPPAVMHHGPFAILAKQWFPSNEELQAQASASKLQQLPWITVFEDLRLLLRSADALQLTPQN